MIHRARSGRQPVNGIALGWGLSQRSRRLWLVAQLLGVFVTMALVSSASPSAALAGGGYGGGSGGNECTYGWGGSGCEQCYFEFGCESVSFSIVKEQRIAGEHSYTANKLTGDVGQKIEYKITVTNTGNSTLNLGPLSDGACTNINPSGSTVLRSNESETFTCEHVLGQSDHSPYTNYASIEGCLKSYEKQFPCGHGYGQQGGTPCKVKQSNTVEVELSPSFAIKKEQRIKGESTYTTAKLKAKIGQTVEYLITVEDTGSSTVTFGSLTDAKCTNIKPTGSFELAPGSKKSFTCEHVLGEGDRPIYTNAATIEGCLKSHEKEYPCGHGYGQQPGTTCKVKESNTVEVEVEVETPSFNIKKEQRIKGESSYTAAKLKGKVGQTVEYLITVENNGGSAVTFGALTDAKCTNIKPSGSSELAAGAKETFTCEHVLAEGDKPIYTNVATIEGCLKSHEKEFPCGHGYGNKPGTTCKIKESNTVEVEVEVETPLFTIHKEQRIQGELSYTAAKLKGQIGQTIEYLITVENTGGTAVTFGPLTDAKCTNIKPSGSSELAAGAKETFTCEHVLVEADAPIYTNAATIEGCLKSHEKEFPCGHGYGNKPGTTCKIKESNTVEVEVEPAKPSFEIKKEQRIAGEAGFTTAKLTSEVGKKVEYKITVTNTGNTTLKFSALTDTKCSGISPAGETVLKAKEAETFSCEHTLGEGDENPYKNSASIEANKEPKTSNTVEVEIKKPNFEIKKEQRLKGEVGYSTSPPPLKGEVGETVEYKITVKNTGNTTIKFEAVKDAKCTNFSPALAAFELAPGAEQVYTCEHLLVEGDGPIYTNAATVKGGEKEKETPPVEVEVKETHGFEIKKEQRIAGEAGFTTAKLTSEVGKKVEYKITVTNTGNTTLKFSALTDTKCSGISPAGETVLKAKEAETFSCEHTLGEGDENPYKNSASIEANKEPKTSNTVEVEIKKPNFEIKKEQRLKGEVGYSTSPPPLKGEVGETVEYKITVKNTGNTTIKFEAVKDAKCTNFSPALAAFELAPGAEQVYTCEHLLVEGDGPIYTNAATVKGGEKEKETPPVEVEVKETHGFEIKKEQRIAGEAGFTTAKLTSEVGKKVEYKITVTNTGNTTLKFSALTDTKCSGISPAGETVLKAKEAETFSCEHTLGEGDENPYKNSASIEANKEPKTSNTVEVEIKKPNFEIKKEQRLKGEVGYSTSPPPLKGEVGETVEYKITVKNTGNTTIKFEAVKDAKCTNFSPALAAFELAPGAEQVYTCEHLLVEGDGPIYTNAATVKGGEKEKETPPVEVEVKETHGFEIKKEQRIAGEAGFTTAKLTSEVGKKVEYKITVTNTGNTTLKFSALTDTKCSGISPAGETVLKAKEAETFSCEHTLGEGDENPYKNSASIEANKEPKTSNTVEVEIKKPNFEIKKEQRLKGEVGYSTSPPPLKGEVGETVEYKITVKNTGNTTIKFEAVKDAKCTNFSPALAAFELAPGAEQVYTCEHLLVEGDGPIYTNAATVKGGEKEKETPPVEVEVKETHGFEIKKEQRIAGEAGFTTAKLTSEVGKKVEYKITVTNTGNTTLKFSALTDTKCSGISPAGETVLKAKEAETFSCEHTLGEGDENPYKNSASIEANKEPKTSNTVEVEIKKPNFEIKKEQRLKGEVGYSTSPPPLKGEVGETVEYKITVKNTGNTTIKFEAVKDAKCTNFSPALAAFELAPGAEQVYTCEHLLVEGDGPIYTNAATVKGGEKEKETPPVEVEVKETHGFEIKKEQRIAGEAGFTTAKLTSEVGKKVEYKITVTNTGNTTLKFSALTDTKCSGISPAGETVLKAKEAETFSCEHTLGEGDENPYKNSASIEANKEPKTSNTVEVEIKKPNFEIKKEQRLKGEVGYSTSPPPLKGEVGETVEYKITVKNTGNTTIKFEAVKDAKCTNFSPALAAFELAPGAEQVYTCEHLLVEGDGPIYTNAATVKGGEKEKETPPVEVEVKETHGFEIKKEQRIAGEANYTKSELFSEIGKKVEYLITVKNTGNTTVKFGALKDAKCTNINPSVETTLKAGEMETFTCEHVLVAGDKPVYVNVAAITGGGVEKESNTVVVKIKEEEHKPGFTITKFQEIRGSGKGFTAGALVGSVGQTVDYELIVKNTGNTPLTFSNFTDTKCVEIVEGRNELLPGEETTYTCHHVITEVGDWVNEGTITGTPPGESPITHTSNQVVVYDALFKIEKLQRLSSNDPFTTFELTGTVGQVVQYEIVVTNTSEISLTFSNLTDPNCQNITGGPGANPVPPGQSTVYTCEHALSTVGPYANEASVEGNEGAGTKTSNKVVVNVTAAPVNPPPPGPAAKQQVAGICDISESSITLHGASGSKKKPFNVSVPSLGIKEITFYVDGHKLKTLTAAHAVKGQFVVTVDPRKYHFGAHKVSIKTVMTNAACARIARTGVFVRAKPAAIKPKFTG